MAVAIDVGDALDIHPRNKHRGAPAAPPLASASAQSLPVRRFAVGLGVNQAVRQIGAVPGVSVAVAVVAARGTDALPAFASSERRAAM